MDSRTTETNNGYREGQHASSSGGSTTGKGPWDKGTERAAGLDGGSDGSLQAQVGLFSGFGHLESWSYA